jgi:hypothetical protein
MKTTIEISDPLLREARKLAEREGVTLRALVERGLRRVVTETKAVAPFKLRRASFKGKGCSPTCPARAGAGCAIWPMKVAGLDRCRPIFIDLLEPNRLVPPSKP